MNLFTSALDRVCHTVLNTVLGTYPVTSLNNDTLQLQLESILDSPAWSTPDLTLMDQRNVREGPVIVYREEVVDPYLAALAAKRGLRFELWLRGDASVHGKAAYDRAANKALARIYGPDYLLHDRVGGCHFITLLRTSEGTVIASSIYVFRGNAGFRGYMEQVHSTWRTPSLERLLFELGHSAAKFLALYDPFIAHYFTHTPYLTVETGLDACTYRIEDELLLRSLGYSWDTQVPPPLPGILDTDPEYVYHKHIRLSL
jgi:hypothetical protein